MLLVSSNFRPLVVVYNGVHKHLHALSFLLLHFLRRHHPPVTEHSGIQQTLHLVLDLLLQIHLHLQLNQNISQGYPKPLWPSWHLKSRQVYFHPLILLCILMHKRLFAYLFPDLKRFGTSSVFALASWLFPWPRCLASTNKQVFICIKYPASKNFNDFHKQTSLHMHQLLLPKTSKIYVVRQYFNKSFTFSLSHNLSFFFFLLI